MYTNDGSFFKKKVGPLKNANYRLPIALKSK